jgi:molecular chaperone DnaJ
VLSDANKRQVYDSYGLDGLKSGGYNSTSWEFMDGFPDLSDLFANFFGGGFARGGRRRGPQQGNDLRFDLELDFLDAAFGVEREITIERLEHCDACQGSGAAPGAAPAACTTCGGAGQVRQSAQTILGQFTQIVTCPRCQGEGMMITDPCKTCQGKGRKRNAKKLTLTIPAGVDTGTRLRVTQEGDAGPLGGPHGDLYVVVQVKPHQQFARDGYNIISTLNVSYAQLALGAEVEVPVLRGVEKIRIPSGTQNGHVFTFRKAGIAHLNNPSRIGDHLVQVQIAIPTHITGEERKLLERLLEIQTDREKHQKGHQKNDPSFLHKFKEVLSS